MGSPLDVHARRSALAKVLWIGGPPDAGKSTVAARLGAQQGLPVYHFAPRERDHIARADPARHPTLAAMRARIAALGRDAWLEDFWVRRPPEEMARASRATWSERVSLAVEDLLALPVGRAVIAEGAGFFPDVVTPLLSHSRQAVWLVPTEGFKRASHARRGKASWRHTASDPERANRNHIERDVLLAEYYRAAVRAAHLTLVEVDGTRSLEEITALVAAHFGPLLIACDRDAPAAESASR